jgi:predicted transcriptional regulator
MSLKTLIKESRAKKDETVSLTVRLTVEINSVVEEMAEQLSISKQRMLMECINEGLEIAKNEFLINEVSNEKIRTDKVVYHLFNTNKGNDSRDGIRMMKYEIVSAFYGNWKKEIDTIKKDDIVFLYENGVGIIAYGKATGDTIVTDRNGDKDEMHYQKLNDFIKLDKPLKASLIKKILNREIVFMRTHTYLDDGKLILNSIKQ